ncbi:MAG: shikimate dehydrogenase [Hoeflea sp.]|uniref:shikimate dehydrogenase n=1 Tax=Hoeflea sp. TaxID=1940281 RepID=UPI0032EDCE97
MADNRNTIPKAFVIGDPISHSRSPLIHRHWLETNGIRGAYDPVHVRPAELAGFAAALRDGSSGYAGGNVTIPHKQAIADLVDHIDETATQIGAINTLWRENGRLHAGNTDSHGFAANLDASAPGWERSRIAVVLGAGGASRAVLHALVVRGIPEIRVVNRTVERARELADRFGPTLSAHPMDGLHEAASGADLFINTTSLGMDGAPAPAIDFTTMNSDALVTDIVYVPLLTPILKMAADQGFRSVDGLGMLLHQAVPGFERWFGVRPQVTSQLRGLVIADMEAHR